jgi:WD40 repeat protein
VLAVAFSAAGDHIVTASADRTLRVWEAGSGRLLRSLTNHTDAVNAVVFRPPLAADPGEPTCASASDDRTVRLWQPTTGRMVRILRGHAGRVLAVAWSRDGARLHTAGADGVVRTFEGESDRLIREVRATQGWVYRLAVSPDGRRLATGDSGGRVRLWPEAPPASAWHVTPPARWWAGCGEAGSLLRCAGAERCGRW